MFLRLLVLASTVAAVASVTGNQKIYTWTLPTKLFGDVTTHMTNLNKSLADDDASEYVKCFQELYQRLPNELEYKYNKEAYGRKKRDINKNLYHYSNEISFLVSTNYSKCVHRRFALAIRKFEERTCLKFVPYQGPGKHSDAVLMIHDVQNDYFTTSVGNAGQYGVFDSTLDGKFTDFVGSASIKQGGERAFEHEMLHVLGFIHSEDSPYREGPQSFWDWIGLPKVPAKRTFDSVRKLGMWERNSASSNINSAVPTIANYITDWDVYKINEWYNCKTTTYGNKPIDMNNKPAPPKNDLTIVLNK